MSRDLQTAPVGSIRTDHFVIFGRSPFINRVDVERLLPYYTTFGINRFSQDFATDYCVAYDAPVVPSKSPAALYNYFFKDTPVAGFDADDPLIEWYSPRDSWPIVPGQLGVDRTTVLGFKHFTVSVALNFALLCNPTAIYLVGIDHDENDAAFEHYDGIETDCRLSALQHREIKEYVHRCANRVPIYQTNPNAQGWTIPYKDVNELYDGI